MRNFQKAISFQALSGACLAALVMANPAFAQDVPPQEGEAAQSKGGFQEIVVTARSSKESLMTVPVAVSAIGEAEIARYATTDLLKLSQSRPDVEIYGGGSRSGAAFIIRGVGTTADTAGVETSVSIAMDGSQTHRPRVVYSGLFDVAQIDIMKGPQALFFGKNASAGVIAIRSKDPGDVLAGYVRGGYEIEARERYIEAAIDTPITDTLSIRWAGRFTKMRGYIHNIAVAVPDAENPSVILPPPASRWNHEESLGGRVTILWKPSDNYTSNMKATFTKFEGAGATAGTETLCTKPPLIHNSFGAPLPAGFPSTLSDCKANGVMAINDLPSTYTNLPGVGDQRWNSGVPFQEANTMLLTWQQDLDLGKVSLSSKTGFSHLAYIDRGNFNYSEFATYSGGSHEVFDGFSQELRLVTNLDGMFNFTVGGFYEKTKMNSGSALYLAMLGPDSICPTNQPGCTPTNSYMSGVNEAKERQNTVSVFGQARIDITDQLELAGGARYTKVKKRVVQGQPTFVHWVFDEYGILLGENQYLRDRLSEDNISPEATLSYRPNSDTTVYAAFKTGYKVGGIAQPALVVPANAGNVIFKPEKSKGFELGYKTYLMDRKVRLTATAFMYKFKGLQLTSFDPEISSYRINNAADVKQKGLEIDLEFRPNDELTLRAAGSYLEVKYGSFANASCYGTQTAAQGCVGGVQDLTGHQLHRAPKWVGTAGFTYNKLVSNDLMAGITGDVRYRSSAFTNDVEHPAGFQRGYALFNASVRVYQEDNAWELALIGSNLTDERTWGFVNDRPGGQTPGRPEVGVWVNRPREVRLQGTIRF